MQPESQLPIPKPASFSVSPWEKKEHGERSCIEVSYDKDRKTVIVRELTQTRLDRFAAFILGTKADNWYAHQHIKDQREFKNVSIDAYQALAKLTEQKTSLQELIKQIEQQVPVPSARISSGKSQDEEEQDASLSHENGEEEGASSTLGERRESSASLRDTNESEGSEPPLDEQEEVVLTPEQLMERQEKLSKLRAELEKINREIEGTDFHALTNVHAVIEKIRGAVEKSFTELNELQDEIKKTGDTVDKQIQTLSDTVNIDGLAKIVHQAKEIVIKEELLENQSDAFTKSIESLPEEIKTKWDEFLVEWKKEAKEIGLSKVELINVRKTRLEAEIKKIRADFLDYAVGLAEYYKTDLIRRAEEAGIETSTVIEDRSSFDAFQLTLIKQRQAAWDKLIKEFEAVANDHLQLHARLGEIDELIAADKAILKLTLSEEQSLIKMMGDLLSFPGSLIFGAKEDLTKKLTNTESLYAGKIVQCIETIHDDVYELLYRTEVFTDVAEKKRLFARSKEVFNQKSINLEGLKNYLSEIKEGVDRYILTGNDSQKNLDWVRKTWREIFTVFTALPTIIEAEKQVKQDILDEIKNFHDSTFSDDNHPQLKALAERAIQQFQDRGSKNGDLSIFYSLKSDFKLFANREMSLFSAAVRTSALFHKYYAVAIDFTREAATFTGPQREEGDQALAVLRLTLSQLSAPKEVPIDLTTCGDEYILDHLTYDLENKLKIAEEDFLRVQEVERNKNAIRTEIAKCVEDFGNILDGKVRDLEKIEESLNVNLSDIRTEIQDSRSILQEKVRKGIFKKVQIMQAPFQVMGELTYWYPKKPEGKFDVNELSISLLADYLKQLKSEVEEEQLAMEQLLPFEAISDLLEKKQRAMDAANLRIIELRKDFEKTNVTARKTGNLQFANSSILESAMKTIETDFTSFLQDRVVANSMILEKSTGLQKSLAEIKNDPNSLKAIAGELQRINQTMDDLIKKSERSEILSLLDQIRILEVEISKIKDDTGDLLTNMNASLLAAKKAYMESQKATMAEHAATAKKTIDSLSGFQAIHTEAKKLLTRSQDQFVIRLGNSPLSKQAAALHSSTLSPGTSKVPGAPPFENISFQQLHAFDQELKKAISDDQKELTRLDSIQKKADESRKKLEDATKESKKLLEELDGDDELIKKILLETEIKKINEGKTIADKAPEASMFSRITGWFTLLSPVTVYGPSTELTKLIAANGHKIEKITAAIRQAKKPILNENNLPVVTLEEQLLHLNPTHVAFQPLLDRSLKRANEMIVVKKRELETFASRAEAVLQDKLPKGTIFIARIKADATVVKSQLEKLETEFKASNKWFGYETSTSDFKIARLRDHNRKVTTADRAHAIQYLQKVNEAIESATRFENSYQIDKFTSAYKKYAEAKTKVLAEIRSYKETGYYLKAFSQESHYQTHTRLIQKRLENEKMTGKDLIELTASMEKTTELVLLQKSTVIAQEVAELERYNLNKPLEEQLKTLVEKAKDRLHKDDIPLIQTYCKLIRKSIGETIQSKYKEHKDSLHSLIEKKGGKPDVISQLFDKYSLSGQLQNNVRVAVKTELQNYEKDVPLIRVGKKLLVFEKRKTIDEMENSDIIEFQPLKAIERSIEASRNAISSVMDITGLQKADKAFDEAIKSANELQTEFKNQKAFSKSAKTSSLIEEMEKKIKDYVKSNQSRDDAAPLIILINDTIAELKDGIDKIKKAPAGSLVEQIQEIQKIDRRSPLLKTLASALAKDLFKRIQTYESELKSKLSLEPIPIETDKDDFMKRYRAHKPKAEKIGTVAALGRDLKAPNKWLEEFVKVIRSQLNSYEDLLEAQLIGRTKVDFNELPPDELIKLSESLDTRVNENASYLQEINFSQVEVALKAYQRELQICLKQQEDWNDDFRSDGVKAIETLVKQVNQRFSEHFAQPLDDDPKINIGELRKMLQLQRQALMTGMKNINHSMPATLGIAIQSLDVNTPEYKRMRAEIINTANHQLTTQKETLNSYLAPFETINETLQSILGDDTSIPEDWKSLADSYIEKNTDDLSFLQSKFRVRTDNAQNIPGIQDVPLMDLNKEQLLEYETLVNQLVETVTSGKIAAIPSLDTTIEHRLHIKEIETALKAYSVTVESVKNILKKPVKEKEALQKLLGTVLESQNRLVKEAAEQMINLSDSKILLDSLRLAQAALDKNHKLYLRVTPLDLDPWSQVLFEENEGIKLTPENTKKVFDEGFKLDIPPSSQVPHPSTLEVKGINQFIEEAIVKLNYLRTNFQIVVENALDLGISPNDPQIEVITTLSEVDIPNEIAELEILLDAKGMTKGLPTGAEEFTSQSHMRTFDEIVTYKMFVLDNISRILAPFESVFDQLPNFSKYMVRTEAQTKNAPAGGLETPKQYQPSTNQFVPPAPPPTRERQEVRPRSASVPPDAIPDEGILRVHPVRPPQNAEIDPVVEKNKNVQFIRDYLYSILTLLPENSVLNRFRAQVSEGITNLPPEPEAALESSAKIVESVKRTEELTRPIIEAMKWFTQHNIDYNTFATLQLAELNHQLTSLDPRAKTDLNEMYQAFIPTKDINFATERVSIIGVHLMKMSHSFDVIGSAQILDNIYSHLDHLDALPQTKVLERFIASLKTEFEQLKTVKVIEDLKDLPKRFEAFLKTVSTLYNDQMIFTSTRAPQQVPEPVQQPAVAGTSQKLKSWQHDINQSLKRINNIVTVLQKERKVDLMTLSIGDIKRLDQKDNSLKKQLSEELNKLGFVNELSVQFAQTYRATIKDNDVMIRSFQNSFIEAFAFRKIDLQNTSLKDIFSRCEQILESRDIRDRSDQFGRRLQPSILKLRAINEELPIKDLSVFEEKLQNLAANFDKMDLDHATAEIDRLIDEAAEAAKKAEEILPFVKMLQHEGLDSKTFIAKRFAIFTKYQAKQFPALSDRSVSILEKLIPLKAFKFPGKSVAESESVIADLKNTVSLFTKVEEHLNQIDQIDMNVEALRANAPDVPAIINIYMRLAGNLALILTTKYPAGLEEMPERLNRLQQDVNPQREKWKPVFLSKENYNHYIIEEFDPLIATWEKIPRLDVVYQLRKLQEDIRVDRQKFLNRRDSTNPEVIAKRFADDLVKLMQGKGEILASANVQAPAAPPSHSKQFVQHKQLVVNEMKERVADLRKKFDFISANIPVDNVYHQTRDTVLKMINETLKFLESDEVLVKRFPVALSPSVKKPLLELDGNQFNQFKTDFENRYNSIADDLKEIDLAVQTVKENEAFLNNPKLIDEGFNIVLYSLDSKGRVEGSFYNFFLRDKMFKAKAALESAREAFIKVINENSSFNELSTEGKKFRSALMSYHETLKEAENLNILPDIIDQLRMEKKSPGTLTSESTKAIVDGLRAHTNELIVQNNQKLLEAFKEDSIPKPVEDYVRAKINEAINRIKDGFGNFDAIFNRLDPDEIAPMWELIQKQYATQTILLVKELKIDQLIDADLKASQIRLDVVAKLDEFRNKQFFWIAADLNNTFSEVTNDQDKLDIVKDKESYDAYFAAMQNFHKKLDTMMRSLRGKDRQIKNLEEQEMYLIQKYPDSYKQMQDYQLLQLAKASQGKSP